MLQQSGLQVSTSLTCMPPPDLDDFPRRLTAQCTSALIQPSRKVSRIPSSWKQSTPASSLLPRLIHPSMRLPRRPLTLSFPSIRSDQLSSHLVPQTRSSRPLKCAVTSLKPSSSPNLSRALNWTLPLQPPAHPSPPSFKSFKFHLTPACSRLRVRRIPSETTPPPAYHRRAQLTGKPSSSGLNFPTSNPCGNALFSPF